MPFSLGQIVNNRYRIDGQPGPGSPRYQAWDLERQARVELRETPLDSPAARQRFETHVSSLGEPGHPNLAGLVEAFSLPEQTGCLVTEFVEGARLTTLLEQHGGGPLPVEQVQAWAGQLCDALAWLHERRPPVIHGEIRPANIRITAAGAAVLSSPGLPPAAAAAPQGAPAVQSDIYALGATLYHLLTGAPPARPASHGSSVAPARQLNPAVPPALSQALEQALQPDRARRFQRAADFKAALAGAPPAAPQAPPPPARRTPDLRRWLLPGLLVGLLCLLLLGGLAATNAARSSQLAQITAVVILALPSDTPTITPSPTVTATPTATPEPTASPTIQPTPLGGPGRIAFSSNREGNYEIYAMDSDGANLTNLTNSTFDETDPAWSPDGQWLAYGRQAQLFRLPVQGGEPVVLTHNTDYNGQPCWSPDSAALVYQVQRIETKQRMGADGVPILIGNEVGDLAITNLDGTSVSVIAESNGFINNPSWAPDGSRIVFETINTIYSILTNGGAQTRLAQGISPAYSPDGQKIVFVAGAPGSYDLYLMNADGSNPAILTNAPGDDYDPAWSPDGGAIVFTSNRDGNPEIYVISLDGSGLVRLTNNPADDRQPNWAP